MGINKKSFLLYGVSFLFLLTSLTSLQAQEKDYIPSCSLKVSLNPATSELQGTLQIFFPQEKKFLLKKGDLQITSVAPKSFKIKSEKKIYVIKNNTNISISFQGKFNYKENYAENTKENYIDSYKGIQLNELWFPQLQNIRGENEDCLYSLQVTIPKGYTVLSESDSVEERQTESKTHYYFSYHHASAPLHLYASNRYEFFQEQIQIDNSSFYLQTWLLPEHARYSETYREQLKTYALHYYRLFGFFPYQRFAVVETEGQKNFSLPGLAAIGQKYVAQPSKFLAQIFMQQWLGVSTKVNVSLGDWSQGLISYLTDYLPLEKESEKDAATYRQNVLSDYLLYRGKQDTQTVLDFKNQSDIAAESLGSGKVFFIFYLARLRMGEAKFLTAVKEFAADYRYASASWQDLIDAFREQDNKIAEMVLWPWLNSKGLLDFNVTAQSLSYEKGKYTFIFSSALANISREQKKNLSFDGLLYHDEGVTSLDFYAKNERPEEDFSISLNRLPEKLVLDARHKVPRYPSEPETSLRISNILNLLKLNQKGLRVLVVLAQEDEEFFADLLEAIHITREQIVHSSDIQDIKKTNRDYHLFYIFRYSNKNEKLLQDLSLFSYASTYVYKREKVLEAKIQSVSNNNFFNAFLAVSDDVNPLNIRQTLADYQDYEHVLLQDNKPLEKISPLTQQGLQLKIAEPQVLDKGGKMNFQEMLAKLSSSHVICVGEQHTQPLHHLTQLRIIQHLVATGKRVVIGMEMFPQSSQKALDDYIAGKINEEEFLLKSRYYQVWGFSYDLYKPVLDYAREHKIPVRALNIEREIISQVGRGGIASLSTNDRKQLPSRIDTNNLNYRNDLKEFFYSMHGFSHSQAAQAASNTSADEHFANFFEAQVSWDETMAEAAARSFKNFSPSYLVVLAGNGHLQYGYGIPDRIQRRLKIAPVVLLQDFSEKQTAEKNAADYLLVSPSLAVTVFADPRLGLRLDMNAQNKLFVKEFAESSLAKTVGIQKGDVLEKINGKAVTDISTLRTYLYLQNRDVPLEITVSRDGIPMLFSFTVKGIGE